MFLKTVSVSSTQRKLLAYGCKLTGLLHNLKKISLAYSVSVSLECCESCERVDGSRRPEKKGQIGTSDVALLDLLARRWLSVIELANKGLSILPVEVNQ